MKKKSHPVFIINLEKRAERREYVLDQFKGKSEFSASIVRACEHEIGGVGLWNSIQTIVQNIINSAHEYIIICEDDLAFTENYSAQKLEEQISVADTKGADVLLGGISWFSSFCPITSDLIWVEHFGATHFTIVFRRFFQTILSTGMGDYDAADARMASITENAMCIFPFIAVQKDFGYSDATPSNNQNGRVDAFFKSASSRIIALNNLLDNYHRMAQKHLLIAEDKDFSDFVVPAYGIFWDQESFDNLNKQFVGRSEFELSTREIGLDNYYDFGLQIREMVKVAKEGEDDVIIVVTGTHRFTNFYSREFFFKNVIIASQLGANYLSCTTLQAISPMMISENLFWINSCVFGSFTILFRPIYDKILDMSLDRNLALEFFNFSMTSNKMILYPFISDGGDYGIHAGISDTKTASKNNRQKLDNIQKAFKRYTRLESKSRF